MKILKSIYKLFNIVIIQKKYFKVVFLFMYYFFPKNNFGDYYFSLITFLKYNKSFPKPNTTLNSFLFYSIVNTKPNILKAETTSKLGVKKFLKKINKDNYNIPVINTFKTIEEIKSYKITSDIVCKPNHLSRKIIKKKGSLNNPQNFTDDDLNEMKNWFKMDYYKISREKNYKNLDKTIIIEPMLFKNNYITDYKFWTFNGKNRVIQVVFYDEKNNLKRSFYDTNWQKLEFSIYDAPNNIDIEQPKMLREMLDLSAEVSKNFELVRVDMYTDGKNIFIGELTHHPGNAGDVFTDPNGNYVGKKKDLEISKLFLNL